MEKKNPRRKAAIESVAGKSIGVHMTDQECWFVIVRARTPVQLGGYVADSQDKMMLVYRMMEEMDLLDTYQLVLAGNNLRELQALNNNPHHKSVYELSPQVVDFFLSEFAVRADVDSSVVLAPLIQRLKDAKRGEYTIPRELTGSQAV